MTSKIRNTQMTSGDEPAGKVLSSDGSGNVIWDSLFVPLTRNITINGTTQDLSSDRTWNVTAGSSGYAANIYLTNNASTTVGSYNAVSYINDIASNENSVTLTNTETLIKSYLYDLPVGITLIDAGTWAIHFYAKVSSAIGVSQLKFEVFARTIGGVETTLFSEYTGEIDNTTYQYINEVTSIQNAFSVNLTDKLGVRVYGKTTHNAPITIYYGTGDNTASHFNTPLPLRHNQLRQLDWVNSGHVGTASKIAGFGTSGEAVYVDKFNTEDISFEFADIIAGTAKDYTLDIKASFGYTIESACLETDNGTLTGVAVKIGSTAVTSLSSLTVDTSVDETASTGAKTVAAGDRVTLSISTGYTGTPTLIRGKLKIIRT